MREISAVAFDLDGTLYPNYRFYFRLLPFLVRHWPLVAAFGGARNIIRREQRGRPAASLPNFYDYEAQLTAQLLKVPGDEAGQMREKIDTLIYRGWDSYFTSIKLFPHVQDVLGELRAAGLKLGMLSDFPPRTKLEYLGLDGIWDATLSSESTGALKPAGKPFEELASALACPPEQILYVGNSHRYDIIGAARAGMKTARIVNCIYRGTLFRRKSGEVFIFNDYRQLRDFVLQ